MRKKIISTLTALFFLVNGAMIEPCAGSNTVKRANRPIIADHGSTMLGAIPPEWAQKAGETLHIAYGHSSHGSQITYGMMGLTYFKKAPFIYEKGIPAGSIDLRDNPFGGEKDLGNPDNRKWADETRKYLNKNKDINVVIWSWCGQLSTADGVYVNNYLDLMQDLENQFPGVTFVYMTGHLDGTGLEGTLAKNNQQIRDFCIQNNKVLFDFADIESYDPDGNYYGDKYANADCSFDSNGDKKQDKNWAQEWQNSHKEDKDWYACYAAHTEPVNANMKGIAMWWLLTRVAGWNNDPGSASISEEKSYNFYAEKLQTINLFKGTDQGFDLERVPTRLEGATMLTRLLGGEKEALSGFYKHPFKDAEKTWGNSYVGYLYRYNLTKGVSDSKFGCEMKLEPSTYMTFLLRVLGYSDALGNKDFEWDKSLEKARDLGIINPDYYALLKEEDFNRGHMAKLTYLALKQKIKDGRLTLLEKLVNENAIDKKAVEVF